MTRIEIGDYLAVDPRICGGRMIFKGSRIMVADAIELSEDGYSPEGISEQYYGIISPQAVQEALKLWRDLKIKETRVKRTPLILK